MNFKKLTIRILFFPLMISAISPVRSTAQHRCGTMEHEQLLQKKNPQRALDMLQSEIIMQQWIAEHADQSTLRSIDTIPVVVHVLWHTSNENIDSAQVQSQIDVLNEDFGRTNSDTVKTPADFLSAAGSIPFRFCLAARDPDGNPTSGIERRYVSSLSLGTDDQIKFYSNGGLDAWDVNQYLNIWVVNFGGGILGYGEFPTGNQSNTFGVVIQYDAFGRVGTVAYPFDLGRTATHEFSHCLNLYHIWGDDGGSCNSSDLVADTPNQGDANFGCPSFPHTDNCSPVSPGVMFMNYMDYSNDACMNMFTLGQATRMSSAVNSFYPTLLTSAGCIPGVIYVNNASLPAIVSPDVNSQLCSTDFTPVVTIKNWGSDTLTSVTINYYIDNNPLLTYLWNGSLVHLETAEVTLPSATASAGTHTFTAYTTTPNGTPDSLTSQDTSSISFSISTTVVSLPQQEGFQSVTFPPVNWYYAYVNPSNRWKRVTTAGGFGNSIASAKMDNFAGNIDISGQVDDLVMPAMDFTNAPDTLSLEFNVAYAQYDNTTNDSLIVMATADCGETWETLFHKGGNLLTTAPDKTSAFTPTATQWDAYSVSLSQFAGQPEVKIVFRSVSNWGNNLYLDDVNIGQITGIAESQEGNILVSIDPNPSSGILNIRFPEKAVTHPYDIQVLNSVGQLVHHASDVHGNTFTLDLTHRANGTYLVLVNDGTHVISKKMVVDK